MNPSLTRKSFLTLGAALFLVAGSVEATCSHKADRTGEADTSGVRRVVIDAGAGDLVVHGTAKAAKVLVRGEACASSAAQLDKVQVETRRSGDTVTIRVDIEKAGAGWNNEAWLDLDIEVPDTMELEIEDGSGDTVLRNLGKVRFEDGSGDVEVDQVASLKLVDGSGDVEIDNSGELVLEDGSGDLVVRQCSGDVLIEDDGSGEINVKGVKGSVRVRSDGSGSIYVADVGGDFTVDDDGSGDIEHSNVRGKVSIPSEH